VINTEGVITGALGKLQAKTHKSTSILALASQIGVSKDLLYKLDAGRAERVTLDDIDKICLALEITPTELLGFQAKAGDDR